MGIEVVPVTGAGGGTAPQQGQNRQAQSRFTPYVAPKSGLSAFSDAFSPYMMAAMKKHQDQKKRQGIAELMSGTRPGDRGAMLEGDNPRPGLYQSMTQSDAVNALKKATIESSAQSNKLRIQGMNQRATENAELKKLLLLKKEEGLGIRLGTTLTAEEKKYKFMSSEKTKNLGLVHGHEKSQLSEKSRAAFDSVKYVQGSKENMQSWEHTFKDGQAGNLASHKINMQRLVGKQKTELQEAEQYGNVDIAELKHSQTIQRDSLQNAFKAGESNKKISSVEMLAKMEDKTVRDVSENRLKVKSSIAKIQDSTKRWGTEYTERSKGQRQLIEQVHEEKMGKNEFGYKESSRMGKEAHDLLMQKIGNKHKNGMLEIQGKIKREQSFFQNESNLIRDRLQGAIGEDKIRLIKELEGVEARIKHTEDKEMASSNAYLKEEMGLKFRSFDRKTKTDVATIKAKSAEYKAMQGSARLGSTMRKELTGMTKDFIEGLEPVYMNAKDAMRKTSPAGDKAIVFAYARYLRPDSTEMRKHTVNTLQNMSGFPGWLRDMWSKVASGKEVLNPSERNDIWGRLETFHGKHLESYQQKVEAYRGMAVTSGVNPQLIQDMSMSGSVEPFSGGEGTGETEPGAYLSDTGIPGVGGAIEGAYNMFGGMGNENAEQALKNGVNPNVLPEGVTMKRTK